MEAELLRATTVVLLPAGEEAGEGVGEGPHTEAAANEAAAIAGAV